MSCYKSYIRFIEAAFLKTSSKTDTKTVNCKQCLLSKREFLPVRKLSGHQAQYLKLDSKV